MDKKLIEVKNLTVSFGNGKRNIRVVRGVDLCLGTGEIVGILGESGSGKTVSASSIMRLLDEEQGKIDSGEILFRGKDLARATAKDLDAIRGKRIAYVFQNPSQALNPYKRIGRQLTDTLKTHKLPYSKGIVIQVMLEVGLREAKTMFDMYPFQLSGGQNQRVMIAQGILCQPDLLIADEPTSAIDASLKKRILDLFVQINRKYHMAIMIITHDFDVAKYLCERLLIMYGGLVVEEGTLDEILEHPLHPYTRELIRCASSLDGVEKTLYTLDGAPPTPGEFKDECPFYPRCKYKTKECLEAIPDMVEAHGRKVRCVRRWDYE
jgi:peptide/nickel transport system ATP-binding protein